MENTNLKTARASASSNYHVGLNKIQESVISSHFMHRMSQDKSLRLYDDKHFQSKLLVIDQETLSDVFVPALISSCNAFCEDQANRAKVRALTRYRDYGHASANSIGASEFITEVIFDKEFSRNAARHNDRAVLNQKISHFIQNKLAIEMAIPALPFKIPSPLKSRGPLPDLGEVNFLLSLYEIARTIQILYQEEMPPDFRPQVRFTIVSDGLRFDAAINECNSVIRTYQEKILHWVQTLGFGDHVRILDYRSLLKEGLPRNVWEAKSELYRQARENYAKCLWPVFNPDDMAASFAAATEVELDPEHGNREGRFVSRLKSLVYTVRYRSIQKLEHLSEKERLSLYRELTGHIFQPYAPASSSERFQHTAHGEPESGLHAGFKEELRRSMLAEAWSAAIDYIAEIKSDRDLSEDPVLACLPGYLRWTIHAKQGQIAIATPPILGMNVQAWAGSAVFRPTGRGKIRLCSLPALHLEATGAIPVMTQPRGGCEPHGQPLFYIDKELGVSDVDGFLAALGGSFTRRRFS
jgi:pyoverdine/dityrosine biosynthesis protein Dit1